MEQFVEVWPPLPSLINSLSPSASAALNSALGIARLNNQQIIHMEHLLAGLAVKPDGRLQRVLGEAKRQPDDLLTVLEQKFETKLRDAGSTPPLRAVPRLSPHALEALLNARRIADQSNNGYIQHHVLTEGALEVTACEAVQILEDLLHPPDAPKKRRSGPQLARFLSDTADGKDQLDIEPYAQAMALLLINREVQPPLSIGLFGDWGSGKSFFMRRVEHWVGEYGNPVNKETCCSEPVQIRFNAWQYVDADLWSSLVVHILDRISEALAPTPDTTEATRRNLIERLGAFGVRKSELELELEQAKLASTEVRRRAETAAQERSRAQALLDAAESLGVLSDEGRKALAEDLEKADGGFLLALKGAARSPWTWTLLALAVLFGALGYFERLAVLLSALPLVGIAWKVLTAYTSVREAVNAGVEATTTPRDQAEIDRLQRIQEEAQATLNQLEADRARLEAQVKKIDPRARLLELLERRTAYEKSQGLIAQVHTDFQKLERLIAEVQTTASPDRAHVERIVLYIDDLDRCPPKRVVEVLQAVHLLLAFKLFVVVVAVDPRWLRRALEVHFPDLLLTEKTRDDHVMRRATPRDYLEKIFQIPFTLPSLEASVGGAYLASLAGALENHTSAASVPTPPQDDRHPPAVDGSPVMPAAKTSSGRPIDRSPAPAPTSQPKPNPGPTGVSPPRARSYPTHGPVLHDPAGGQALRQRLSIAARHRYGRRRGNFPGHAREPRRLPRSRLALRRRHPFSRTPSAAGRGRNQRLVPGHRRITERSVNRQRRPIAHPRRTRRLPIPSSRRFRPVV